MSSRPVGQRHRSSPTCRSAMPCAGSFTRATVNFLPNLTACFAASCGKLLANELRPTDGSATVQRRNDKQDCRPAVRLAATRVSRRVAVRAITKLLAGGADASALLGAVPGGV